ncbi:carrier superfamily protein [Cyclospora cayetanensis]|uniref:Carrier superfamily protein n=1 Tax=Cyclospora cayetanensis TaxID=88456 RepID=A0A1D3CWI7_9EIME|nr:carrier superfamily protein [Cyclospora cayetanensis]
MHVCVCLCLCLGGEWGWLQEGEGGMVAVLVSALMQEGFTGLYRGLGLQLLKTILAASILFLLKEKLQSQTAQTFARVERLFGSKRRKAPYTQDPPPARGAF